MVRGLALAVGLGLSTACVTRTEYGAVAPIAPEVPGVAVVEPKGGTFGVTPTASTLFVSSGAALTVDARIPATDHLDVRLAARPTVAAGTITTWVGANLGGKIRP